MNTAVAAPVFHRPTVRATALLLLAGTAAPSFAMAATLPLASGASALPLLRRAATIADARAAWRRFMLLNVPLGAAATALLMASWR